MARPKEPLIAKRDVLVAALRIMDDEGASALTVRRLAAELGVKPSSLYHHFLNKEAIVIGAAGLAVEEVEITKAIVGDWRDWLVRNTQNMRRLLLAHPNVIPLIVGPARLRFGLHRLEVGVQRLEAQGVPAAAVFPLIETLEVFAIGCALYEATANGNVPPDVLERARSRYPHLARAFDERSLTLDDQFEIGCRGIIDGIAAAFWLPPPARSGSGGRRSLA